MATMIMKKNKYNLELTCDEAYTLQILLGYVAGDIESSQINEKLENLTGEEMTTYDFDRVVFSFENGGCCSTVINTREDESVVIRFV